MRYAHRGEAEATAQTSLPCCAATRHGRRVTCWLGAKLHA